MTFASVLPVSDCAIVPVAVPVRFSTLAAVIV